MRVNTWQKKSGAEGTFDRPKYRCNVSVNVDF